MLFLLLLLISRAENFRLADIEINAWSPGSTKDEIRLIRISGVDGVISIELNIDWTNVSFGLMFIKTNVHNDYSPQMW